MGLDTDPVSVRPSRLGMGVFAKRSFVVGEQILRITGPRIDIRTLSPPAWRALMDRGEPVQVGPTIYIEPESPGRYVNHSCEPNSGLRPDLWLIAIQPIHPEDEILFDYSTTMQEDYWTMDCRCGTPSCRGTIEDFSTLPEHLRRRYADLGVVQTFILSSSD